MLTPSRSTRPADCREQHVAGVHCKTRQRAETAREPRRPRPRTPAARLRCGVTSALLSGWSPRRGGGEAATRRPRRCARLRRFAETAPSRRCGRSNCRLQRRVWGRSTTLDRMCGRRLESDRQPNRGPSATGTPRHHSAPNTGMLLWLVLTSRPSKAAHSQICKRSMQKLQP